jgi:glutamate/tyrosine decarboxylase-like PLP-dependent enzyme
MIGFLAGRRAVAPWNIRAQGLDPDLPLRVYVSAETHTWIQKAADLFGLGTSAIRWIPVTGERRMDVEALEHAIGEDRARGALPFLVVAAAGTVSTGAIDPLDKIADICERERMHFHVDGAYGAPAAILPELAPVLSGLARADTIALDPHKWLYAPVEAGCVLARDPSLLIQAFSFRPPYYRFDEDNQGLEINYYEHGLQNSRAFRALKVWLALRQVGRTGYVQMVRDDIALARRLFDCAAAHPELEAATIGLSVATFRYLPPDVRESADDPDSTSYLNDLNAAILDRLQAGGEVYVSNAIVDGRFLLRACVVNFRTTPVDIDRTCEVEVRVGREMHERMRA